MRSGKINLATVDDRPLQVCFFAPVDDRRKLEHVGFYQQDIQALRDIGCDVTIATKWNEIPWTSDVYFVWWWTWAFKPLIKAKLRRKPTIITGTFNLRWGSGDYYHRPLLQRALLRASVRVAEMNLFVSQHELRPIVKMNWTKRARYSPHCVDTDVYSPSSEQRNTRELLTIGWLRQENVERKGMPDIIRSLPDVLSKYPDVRLTVIGEEDTGKHLLDALARDLGVDHAVTFAGRADEDEKIEHLRHCTVYLQPSKYEGFGLAILEAMSCGAPVITRRVGAVPEVVGEAGLFAGEGHSALTKEILRVLDDPGATQRISRDARARATEHFPLTRRRDDICQALTYVTRRRS